jgi:hypothetical protein
MYLIQKVISTLKTSSLLLSVMILLNVPTAMAKSASGSALIEAIHQVETSGRLGPILGDGGDALGPLQIHRAYHQDSGVAGPYSRCADFNYSVQVFKAYMARYATVKRLGRKPTYEDIARIHNGGPNGYKRKSTLAYWAKVKKELK